MTHTVTRVTDSPLVDEIGGELAVPGTLGLRSRRLLGKDQGSTHLDISVCELESGGVIAPHTQPFEESFFVLEGSALVTIGTASYEVSKGDFGFAAVGESSAWRNPFEETFVFYRLRAPQPRAEMGFGGVYASDSVAVPSSGERLVDLDAAGVSAVGHYETAQLPPPGPIFMKGYRGYGIKNIQMRMMLDELNGAVHHTMFAVQFNPADAVGTGATVHYHPFEEAYLILSGTAEATLDGTTHKLAPGDLAWTSVNGTHGFLNTGDAPVQWIEVQVPVPPPSGAFYFPDEWDRLAAHVACLASNAD